MTKEVNMTTDTDSPIGFMTVDGSIRAASLLDRSSDQDC